MEEKYLFPAPEWLMVKETDLRWPHGIHGEVSYADCEYLR